MMLYAGLTAAPPAFSHAGTPPGITHSFDCAARKAAYSFGQTLLPGRGDFKTLFQALQLQACNMTTPTVMDEYRPPHYDPPVGTALYVDPLGDDVNPGTLEQPLRSIAAAVAKTAGKASGATVLLRGGTHYTPETVEIGPEHSGLTIQVRAHALGWAAAPNPSWSPKPTFALTLTPAPTTNPNFDPEPDLRPSPLAPRPSPLALASRTPPPLVLALASPPPLVLAWPSIPALRLSSPSSRPSAGGGPRPASASPSASSSASRSHSASSTARRSRQRPRSGQASK